MLSREKNRRSPLAAFGAIVSLAFVAMLLVRFTLELRREPAAVVVSLAVAFCDADLVCDPEENWEVCPGDCKPPEPKPEPEPEPKPKEERDGRSRSSAARRVAALNVTGAPRTPSPAAPAPEVPVVTAPEMAPEQAPESPGPIVSSATPASGVDLAVAATVAATPASSGDVEVAWRGSDGAEVRVLRGDDAFPVSPDEGGVVVYEGFGDSFVDGGASEGGGFYSVFVRRGDGSYGPAVRVASAPRTAPESAPETSAATVPAPSFTSAITSAVTSLVTSAVTSLVDGVEAALTWLFTPSLLIEKVSSAFWP